MKKSQKKILSKTNFVNSNALAYFLDCIFVVALTIFAFLELYKIIKFPICVSVSTDIIVSLIPTVITIITVAIQIQNEPVRGIPLRQFERLRKGFYFNLLHMSLVVVFIFVFETLFQLANLETAIFLLDSICIVYSIIFLIQEIPILFKNDGSINRVLRRVVSDTEFLKQEKYGEGEKVVANTLLTFGIEETFRMLRSNKIEDKELLIRLLDLEDGYFSKVLEDTLDNDKKETIHLFGLEVISAIDVAFKDIEYLLNKKNKINVGLISDDKGSEVYTFVRLTYLLQQIMFKLGYQNKFKSNIESLVNFLDISLYSKKIEEHKEAYRYLLLMMMSNIQRGELWFLEAYRDKDFSPMFFDILNNPLSFFISMYMCFYLNSSYGNQKYKETLMKFLDAESDGINSEGFTWKSKLKKSFENNLSGKYFLSGIHEYLKIKDLLSDGNYEIRPPKGGVYSIDDSTSLSDELFFDYCTQILLFNYYFDINEAVFENFMKNLSPSQRTAFKYQFQTKWRDSQRENYPVNFYRFIFNEVPKKDLIDNATYEIISKFFDETNQKDYEKKNLHKDNKEIIKEIKNILNEKMPKICKGMSFYNSKINVEKQELYYIPFYVDLFDYKELIDLNLKNVKSTFVNIAKKEIKASTPPTEINGLYFDEHIIKTILNSNPKYCGYCWRFGNSLDETILKRIKKIKQIEDGVVPHDMFIQDKAIKLKFKYLKNKTIVRSLRKDEIDHIIDREFTMINGLYRYSKYPGSNVDVFYITRDQLAKYISDRRVYVAISFKYFVDADKEKILYFCEKTNE